MGTSGTENCEGCLSTQSKHLPPPLVLRLNLVRLTIIMITHCESIKYDIIKLLL